MTDREIESAEQQYQKLILLVFQLSTLYISLNTGCINIHEGNFLKLSILSYRRLSHNDDT